jgi:hypothetical protein
MPRTSRPEWVRAEYERIGKERAQASREADRAARWELARSCGEMLLWMIIGLIIVGFAFHVHNRDLGEILLRTGVLVNCSGVLFSLSCAYRRGQDRGDW